MRAPSLLVPILAACSAGCRPESAIDPSILPSLRGPIAAAAADYRDWGVVGPHVLWAPELCRAPPPPAALHSFVPGGDQHGGKLFALYASDAAAFLEVTRKDGEPRAAPVGLTLVKEAYRAEPADVNAVPAPLSPEASTLVKELGFYPFATLDGMSYRAGARSDLFVMIKMEDGTPGTEQGWAYGTVDPEGVVTSAGRVESCVRCHLRAKRDQLFRIDFD